MTTRSDTPRDWHQRCDWCGWPLKETAEQGCVIDNCSMRPLPVLTELQQHVFDIKQQCRKAEAELAESKAGAIACIRELRDITRALNDDRTHNTLTIAEVCAALRAERDAARADAERYRWLSQQPCHARIDEDDKETCYLDLCPSDLDAAIDEARAAAEPGGEKRIRCQSTTTVISTEPRDYRPAEPGGEK